MRRTFVLAFLVPLLTVSSAGLAVAQGQPPVRPHLTSTTRLGIAVDAISCPSDGNCVVGGTHHVASSSNQAVVVAQVRGVWTPPRVVAQDLNVGGQAQVNAVSCPSPGHCLVAGSYSDANNATQAFVAQENNGAWGPAQEIAGDLNSGGNAAITSVACASVGDCVAGGEYAPTAGGQDGFVVSETGGVWGTVTTTVAAKTFNNIGTPNGPAPTQTLVSCSPSAGCAAAGSFQSSLNGSTAFVLSESGGHWGAVKKISLFHSTYGTTISSVSCAPRGFCAVGGNGFVMSSSNGVWGRAKVISVQLASHQLVHGGFVYSLVCPAPDQCVAGGRYIDAQDFGHAFVVAEKDGVWGTGLEFGATVTREVSGQTYNGVEGAQVDLLSCAKVGECVAAGQYVSSTFSSAAFSVSESKGAWGAMDKVTGTTGGEASLNAVSCVSDLTCLLVGYDRTGKGYTFARKIAA